MSSAEVITLSERTARCSARRRCAGVAPLRQAAPTPQCDALCTPLGRPRSALKQQRSHGIRRFLVVCHCNGVEVEAGNGRGFEMAEAIFTSNEGCAVPLGVHLARGCRHVVKGQADASIVARIGPRCVRDANVVQGHLAGLKGHRNCFGLIHIEDFLAAREEIVLVVEILMLHRCVVMGAR